MRRISLYGVARKGTVRAVPEDLVERWRKCKFCEVEEDYAESGTYCFVA
jgi:hypothetical protein